MKIKCKKIICNYVKIKCKKLNVIIWKYNVKCKKNKCKCNYHNFSEYHNIHNNQQYTRTSRT